MLQSVVYVPLRWPQKDLAFAYLYCSDTTVGTVGAAVALARIKSTRTPPNSTGQTEVIQLG